jgi:hypothetical protein
MATELDDWQPVAKGIPQAGAPQPQPDMSPLGHSYEGPAVSNADTGNDVPGVGYVPDPMVAHSIMDAFGEKWNEATDPSSRLGLSDDSIEALRKAGIFEGKNSSLVAEPFQKFNEAIIMPTAAALDSAKRITQGLYSGVQGALVAAGVPKDVVSIPDAFAGSPGDLAAPVIAKGETPKIPGGVGEPLNLAVAKDLDVIGPEKPPLSEAATPEEAAKIAVPPTPGQVEKPSPWRQRFNETLAKIETTDDARALIQNSVDRNNEFAPAREGNISTSQLGSLSEVTGIPAEDIDVAKTSAKIKTNDEMRNVVQALTTIDDKVHLLSQQIAEKGGAGDDALLEELTQLRIQRNAVVDAAVQPFVALRAEFGRAGNVIQEFMKAKSGEEGLNGFLKSKGMSPDDLREQAKMIAATPRESVPGVVNSMRGQPPGAFYWTWVQGLISGIITHTKYLAANELFALTQHGIETPLAAALGKIKQVAGVANDGDKVLFGEAGAGLWGHFAAVPDAVRAAYRAVRYDIALPTENEAAVYNAIVKRNEELKARGEKPEPIPPLLRRANEAAGLPSQRPEIFTREGGGALGQAAGTVLGLPGRSAKGIHTFFRILGEQSSMRAQAYRKAINEGASPGDALFQRQAQITANATEAMQRKAVEDGYYSTFMGETSEGAKRFQRWAKNSTIGKWVFPFTHIPRAILAADLERVPGLNMLNENVRNNVLGRNGGIAQDTAIARMVLGSSVLGYFAMKYMNGTATGDYPTDPKDRDNWKLTGKIPNSVLIGNTWYSMNKFGPAGSIANLGANVGAVVKELQSGDDDAMSKATWKATEAAYHLVGDEVGFQSLANFFEAMQDENKAASIAATTVSTAVPFSSLLGQTASVHDPYMRQVKTFLDGLKYRIPGERETLLPKRDWSGEPVPNPQAGSIIRQRQVNADPVDNEMAALGIHPAPPQDRIGTVKLPPNLYDRYQTLAGPLARAQLETFVQQPGWQNVPFFARQKLFHGVIEASRRAAAAQLMMQHPEIIQQGVTNRTNQILNLPATKLAEP